MEDILDKVHSKISVDEKHETKQSKPCKQVSFEKRKGLPSLNHTKRRYQYTTWMWQEDYPLNMDFGHSTYHTKPYMPLSLVQTQVPGKCRILEIITSIKRIRNSHCLKGILLVTTTQSGKFKIKIYPNWFII